MKQKVVIFGCSFSAHLFEHLRPEHPYVFKTLAKGGNSNQRIITEVYDYVNSDEYQPSDILNIQYSYTNRFWTPSRLNKPYLSFHGLRDGFIYQENRALAPKLKKFNELYLTLFFDNKLYFEHHLKQVDLLKTYLDSKNVKYNHYLHNKDSHYWEIAKNNHDGWDLISDSHMGGVGEVDLEKYGLTDFEGEECMLDWTLKNNYNISEDNVHLILKGEQNLLEILMNKWKDLK
jgi:hypothetical protein